MLRNLGASDCHRRGSAGRDDGLGRVCVAAGSRLRRSSGHVGGRSCRGAVRGRSGLGSGDGWVLRVRDGITHGLGGRCEEAVCGVRNGWVRRDKAVAECQIQVTARSLRISESAGKGGLECRNERRPRCGKGRKVNSF